MREDEIEQMIGTRTLAAHAEETARALHACMCPTCSVSVFVDALTTQFSLVYTAATIEAQQREAQRCIMQHTQGENE
jgi:hypothetical protein